MSSATTASNVDYRLLGLMSDPQIVSPRHTPRSLCAGCAKPKRRNLRRILTHLIRR